MTRTIAVVAVSNVNVRDLPGTEAEPNVPDLPKRTWVTFHVRVEGEWANGTLDITDADGRTTDYVAVVGTIGDIDPLAPFLHSRYPYNLCIVRADRSAAELEEVAAALRKLNYPWDIWIDAAIARVAVHVPIFDQPTAEAIRPYASSVSIRPLVRSR